MAGAAENGVLDSVCLIEPAASMRAELVTGPMMPTVLDAIAVPRLTGDLPRHRPTRLLAAAPHKRGGIRWDMRRGFYDGDLRTRRPGSPPA
ncbi:hypothetical protein, partial [Nocardia abscessus]|uniref:hypothetical protein n=1 Tax=Nocardia abscessus TaxID=120957 RepID=UPI00245905BC